MSVYLYDDAIIKDLRRITGDDRISIQPSDNVFDTIARMNNDEILMPLINVSRIGWGMSDARPHMMKFDGAKVSYDPVEERYSRFQAIPIRIDYQLEVWTNTREENDNILRELIWYYSTHPTLMVKIPYGLDIEHKFNIIFDGDVEDDSDIVNHKNTGRCFRQSLSFYVDDAYLWKSSSRGPTTVVLNKKFGNKGMENEEL